VIAGAFKNVSEKLRGAAERIGEKVGPEDEEPAPTGDSASAESEPMGVPEVEVPADERLDPPTDSTRSQ